jgi:hypothetical protein
MAPDDTEKTRNWANTKALVSEAVGSAIIVIEQL